MSLLTIGMVSSERFLSTSGINNVKELSLLLCFGLVTSHPTNVLLYKMKMTLLLWHLAIIHPRCGLCMPRVLNGPKGESTLRGGQKCYHIVLFSRGVHVWTSTMIILEHIFPNFLHNMVDYNTKNSIARKIHFPTYIVWLQSIFVEKKCTSLCTKKCKYTQKMSEMIFSIYEICSIY
jgi:hypothetical protein